MLEMLGTSLVSALTPPQIIYMIIGVLFGVVMGFIPGIGGVFVLVMLLPFVFNLSTEAAIALLISAHAVVATGGSISAILFGVPGSPVNAATVFDGYPMSQKGQAGRAIGVALGSSTLGGIIGAIVLLMLIPVVRPIVMSFGPAEMLFLALTGVSMISVLSGSNPIKGAIAGMFGILISLVGEDWVTGAMRYTFNSLYLWDGLKMLPVLLGLFAVSEMVHLCITGGAIAKGRVKIEDSPITGLLDVVKNWWLVVKCAVIGAVIGIIPGLGGDIANFIAYGYAGQSSGNKNNMGTGVVQGVLGPESANNAKEGGALVPTLAFGIPGSAGMAVLLGALTIIGLIPGRDLLGPQLSSVILIIAMLVISNIFGAALILPFVKYLARITTVNVTILAPIVLIITMIGAFNASRSFGDIVTLLIFGFIGYEMKKLGYSRPALILGFILGVIIERNMWLSYNLYGIEMMKRPVVLILTMLLLLIFFGPVIKSKMAHKKGVI